MSSLTHTVVVIQASIPEHIEQARQLFIEYADSLGFSLCFQNFDQELKNLPGTYDLPSQRLLLAQEAGPPPDVWPSANSKAISAK